MWAIFKAFIEFVTTTFLCFMFWFFGHESCGILTPHSGIEPASRALEARSLNHWTAREVPSITLNAYSALLALKQLCFTL